MVYLTKEEEKNQEKSSLQLRFLASDDRGQKMNRKKMMKAIIEYKLLVFFSLIFFSILIYLINVVNFALDCSKKLVLFFTRFIIIIIIINRLIFQSNYHDGQMSICLMLLLIKYLLFFKIFF